MTNGTRSKFACTSLCFCHTTCNRIKRISSNAITHTRKKKIPFQFQIESTQTNKNRKKNLSKAWRTEESARLNGKKITKNVMSNNEKQHRRMNVYKRLNRTTRAHIAASMCSFCVYLFRQLCFLRHKFLLFLFFFFCLALVAAHIVRIIEWLLHPSLSLCVSGHFLYCFASFLALW